MDDAISKLKAAWTRAGARQIARLFLAICAMFIWSLFALFYIVDGFVATRAQSVATGSSGAAALVPQATAAPHLYGSASFYEVLATSGTVCPPGKSIPLLTDYIPSYNLGNYYLYPRKLDLVQSSEPFDAATLNMYVGGCLLTFGDNGTRRVAPFKSRLEEVTCSFDGCLYRVK